jgi:SHS2 domain-containing protein
MGPGQEAGGGHELLEHTADLGIRAWGPSPERAFEEAAAALFEVLDVRPEAVAATEPIALGGTDLGGLLVDLLNELVFLAETREEGLFGVRVMRVTDRRVEAEVDLGPLTRSPEGTVVKAATYHQLRVEVAEGGATTLQVFLDV